MKGKEITPKNYFYFLIFSGDINHRLFPKVNILLKKKKYNSLKEYFLLRRCERMHIHIIYPIDEYHFTNNYKNEYSNIAKSYYTYIYTH